MYGDVHVHEVTGDVHVHVEAVSGKRARCGLVVCVTAAAGLHCKHCVCTNDLHIHPLYMYHSLGPRLPPPHLRSLH